MVKNKDFFFTKSIIIILPVINIHKTKNPDINGVSTGKF